MKILAFVKGYLKSGWMPGVLFALSLMMFVASLIRYPLPQTVMHDDRMSFLLLCLIFASCLGVLAAAIYQLFRGLWRTGLLNLGVFLIPASGVFFLCFHIFSYGLFGVSPGKIYRGYFKTSQHSIQGLVGRGQAWRDDYSYWVCFKSNEDVQLKNQKDLKLLGNCEAPKEKLVKTMSIDSQDRPWFERLFSKGVYLSYINSLKNDLGWECLSLYKDGKIDDNTGDSGWLLKNSKEKTFCFTTVG